MIRAAGHLETALHSFYFFNPMRQVSSFVWIQQVERLWFEYLVGLDDASRARNRA